MLLLKKKNLIIFILALICTALTLCFSLNIYNNEKPAHAATCPYHVTPLPTTTTGNYINLTSGTYYLTGNVTVSKPIYIAANATVNICLNGYIITFNSATVSIGFRPNSGSTLNIYDCGNTVEQKHYYTKDPTTGRYVFGSGTDYISGGVICHAGGGTGITNSAGTINIHGGTLAGCQTGIRSDFGTLNVEGVTFCGNSYGIYSQSSTGPINLSGCEITDNRNGLVLRDSNATIQGDVNIYDNYALSGALYDVYLYGSSTLEVGSAGLSPNTTIGIRLDDGQNYTDGMFFTNNSSQSDDDLLNNYFIDDKNTHRYGTLIPQVDPTCTTDGLQAYYVCSLHGEYFDVNYNEVTMQDLVIPALGHSYSVSWQWATDYSSATATYICTNCGDTGTLTATITNVKTDPDCTNDGNIVYTATVTLPDGTTATDTQTVTLPATGHTYQVTGWVWSSDYSTATLTYVCSVCGDTDSITVTTTSVRTDPTCTVDGSIVYTATATLPDGTTATDTQTVTLPATGHSYSVTWQWASDYSSATATYVCSVCGDTDSITVTPTSVRTDPTCTVDGNIVYTATVTLPDGTTATDTATDTIPTTGHTYQVTSWQWASDYSTATATYVCSVCGDTGTVTGTPSYVQTDPTCDVDGLIGYTVTVTLPDGTTATDNNGQTLPATGHQWDSGTVVPPTCTQDGYTEYTCGVCGNTKQDNIVPATGHDYQVSGWDWASDYSSASLNFVCTVCGDVLPYTATVTFVDDTEMNTRTYTATVTVDGVIYTDVITVDIPENSGSFEWMFGSGCNGGIDWLLLLCIGLIAFDVVIFIITMCVICGKPKDDEDDEDDEEQDDAPDDENEFY